MNSATAVFLLCIAIFFAILCLKCRKNYTETKDKRYQYIGWLFLLITIQTLAGAAKTLTGNNATQILSWIERTTILIIFILSLYIIFRTLKKKDEKKDIYQK